MAGKRTNKGENNTDGFDFQHYTLLYCIGHLLKDKNRFSGFEIGSGIEGYGALDDIVLHVTLPDSSIVTNLLQVKYSNQTIHTHYLCYNDSSYVLKYFESFLDLKMGNSIPLEQLDQLIIWTNMPLAHDVKDWFEMYVPPESKRDVLEDSKQLSYQRFRFRKAQYENVSFLFHTRMKLVYEIVDGLFNKQKWNPKSVALSYYLTMAEQIIEGNGVEMKFKEEFICGRGELFDEKDRFRRCFEVAMERKFIREKIKSKFSMNALNSEEYRKYFTLNVETKAQVQWTAWNSEEDDLEEFRQRFVFYVTVPHLDFLKTYLMKQVSCFDQVSELLRRCAFKKMINKKQFENLRLLIKLRQIMDVGFLTELVFEDGNDLLPTVVKNFLTDENSGNVLYVKAVQDVNCTVSRLKVSVKNCLAPENDRYLVLSCVNFYKRLADIQMILEEHPLVEYGLKCIIIAAVPRGKLQDMENKLSASEVKSILVGEQLDNGFVDKFDISTLHQDCKDAINNREIFLSEQQTVKAGEIYGCELFRKDNYRLALELFQSQRPIDLGGNELQLHEHFRERLLNVQQEKINVLDLMHREDVNQIILSDQAGMGKSTELTNIALEMRKTYNNHLVICLDCKGALKHYGKSADIAYIVCQMISIKTGSKEVVVRKIIELGKMILLLDGIDEVSDSYKSNLKAFLNTISKTKLFKLIIATRPHCSALIQKIFPSSIQCQLDPFSESDQLEYLMSYWKITELDDENDRIRIEENAKELVKKFRSMLKDGSLIGIPLQTYIVAVIYESSILSKDFEQPKPYKIGYIYQQFITLKFEESIKRQFDLTTKAQENAIRTQQEYFVPYHIKLAQRIYANAAESELEQLGNQLQTYGLVRLHPTVGFIHYTYDEYFLSMYFLTHKTNANEEFVSFIRQNLCTSRDSIVTRFMDFHIDEIDPSKNLETNDSIANSLSCDFQPPPTARLHPDKLREFHAYLLKHCSETERYTLVRNSFNLSVFNVFEVLYDSLPVQSKYSLKFCFGSKSEPNFINLKLLGRNQILQLLNILVKKNPTNFVRLYLTDFGDGDEDFLEVACRKPFVEVVDWLVQDLIPNLNREEQVALYSYVHRRFDKYLQLIVKHNNAQLLQAAIQHARSLWSKTAVKCFLLNRNVLQLFLNTIELPSETKPIRDEQRIEMVQHMHSLFEWAFDRQFLINEYCRNIINNLKISALKSAFNDTFYNL